MWQILPQKANFNQQVLVITPCKYPGVMIDSTLSWEAHVDSVVSNVAKKIGAWKELEIASLKQQPAATGPFFATMSKQSSEIARSVAIQAPRRLRNDCSELSRKPILLATELRTVVSQSTGRLDLFLTWTGFFLAEGERSFGTRNWAGSLPGGSKTSPDWYVFLGYRGLYKRRRRTIFSLHLRRSPTAEDCLSQFSAKSKVLFRLVSEFFAN